MPDRSAAAPAAGALRLRVFETFSPSMICCAERSPAEAPCGAAITVRPAARMAALSPFADIAWFDMIIS
jgi:hypothetical protein